MPTLRTPRSRTTALAAALLATLLALPAAPVSADPPPWAPAHGWRKKNDPYYTGYTGHRWPDDYGIAGGRCYREKVGAVLGGVAGGAIGSTIGKGDGRTVAIVVGAVLGAVVGAKMGRDMDREDRACLGHAFDLAKPKQTVAWTTPAGVAYAVTPYEAYRSHGRVCRDFTSVVTIDGRKEKARGTACQAGDGEWQIVA